ncbi:MAG: NUDIX hydrolase, partial [Ruminococcaceae bacterium]|nr:NUDIX hydrolase [Oscillospiraceae bacterium]
MDFRYCPDCGVRLTIRHIRGRDVRYCTVCEKPRFGVSVPCVICLVVNEYNEIALIKQTYATHNNVCVAGFIEQGEV